MTSVPITFSVVDAADMSLAVPPSRFQAHSILTPSVATQDRTLAGQSVAAPVVQVEVPNVNVPPDPPARVAVPREYPVPEITPRVAYAEDSENGLVPSTLLVDRSM